MMKTISFKFHRGFSLIELMVVLGVVGLLMAFAAPNLFSLITSTSLTGAGTVLRNQLTLAQQEAVAKSTDIEVRFYRFTDLSGAGTVDRYQGYQLFGFSKYGETNVDDPDDLMVPFSRFFRINAPVTMHENLSTIVNGKGSQGTSSDRKFGFDSPREGSARAPVGPGGEMVATEYIAFRFRPDGSTDLPYKSGDDTWHITLVQGEGALQNDEPFNYFCLQINPYNGQITDFRP